MADNQAEKPQAQDKKEEKPKPTTLESAVDESWHAAKAATNTLLGIGATAGAIALFGLDGLILTSSFPIGRAIFEYSKTDGKGKFTSGNFRDESISGAIFTGLAKYGVDGVKQVPKAFGLEGSVTNIIGYPVSTGALAVGAATGLVLNPLLNALYYPLQYLIQNKTFKGMSQDFKKNYVNSLIRTAPLSALTSVAVGLTYAIPALAPLLFPYFALSGIAYRVLMSPEKISYKKLGYSLLSPVYAPFYLVSGAASVAGKAYRGITTAAYDIGSAIGSLFKKAPKPAAPAQPAAQQA